MENIKLKQYYELFTDAWKLFREHSNPDESVDFWKRYEEEVERLDKKHNESEMLRKILLAVTDELVKIEKEKINE